MKQIAAAAFKKQCLALIEDVDPEGIVITKGGKPVAKLIPVGLDSAPHAGSPDEKASIGGKAVPEGQEWGC
jgi:antitoxin (DNA-binding transcriptional repressor) of toxin-antitoxin stability system